MLTLIRWLWFLNPYLQYVFNGVLFIIAGKKIRMMILLYCTILTYDMITSLYLGQWTPPMFFKLTPEQVQNPDKLVKYLQKLC